METISVDLLRSGPLEKALYHESGEQLFSERTWLSDEDITALKDAGITNLTALSLEDNSRDYIFLKRFKEAPLTSLINGQVMSSSVYSREGRLLLTAGITITEAIIERLHQRSITNIYIKRSDQDLKKEELDFFREIKSKEKEEAKITPIEVEFNIDRLCDPRKIHKNNIEELIGSADLHVADVGDPFLTSLKPTNPHTFRPPTLKEDFISTHNSSLGVIREIFHDFSRSKPVSPALLNSVIGKIVGGLIRDRELLVNLSHLDYGEEDYLFNHSLNVMILSINIGTQLGYNRDQLLELAHGALLADIGMVKIPDHILKKREPLSPGERLVIERHPAYSLDLLQSLPKLPLTTPFIAYQSHERQNGSGYPKRRRSNTIHEFAKIVAVADIYDALTRDRPYRPRLSPYRAMEGVLKICNKRAIDEKVLRAFLNVLSVFPIGSFLLHDDNSVSKVISATNEMTKPIVRVIIEKGKRLDIPYTLDLRDPNAPSILRNIDHNTISFRDIMYAF